MFCLATNKRPVIFLKSTKYFPNLAMSVAASIGAPIPPLNKKSLLATLFPEIRDSLEGISLFIYGWLLLPPRGLSFPYLKDLRSVVYVSKPDNYVKYFLTLQLEHFGHKNMQVLHLLNLVLRVLVSF